MSSKPSKTSPKYPSEVGNYYLQSLIGEGAFSVVCLCRHKKTNQYYACKIVPRRRLNTRHLIIRFEIEIRINQQLHHPGIVRMIDLKCDDDNYYVFMEFCPNGDLFQYIIDKRRLSEEEAKPIFRQILETLKYIHEMGISHRDLKPENILIDQFGKIKISDFGLSKFFDHNNLVDTPCGSPCYASPECVSGKSYNGITTDVWSCGVILYAMMTGQLPWTKRNQTQLFQQIKKGEYTIPAYLSPTCRNMIKMLMTVDQKERYTIEQALQDPWLSETPQQMDTSDQKGYVSIKQVDKYFGREISCLDLDDELSLNVKTSLPSFDYNKVCFAITGEKKERKKRRHHKKRTKQTGDDKNSESTSNDESRHKRHKKSRKEKTKEIASPSTSDKHVVIVAPRNYTRKRQLSRPFSAKILLSSLTTASDDEE